MSARPPVTLADVAAAVSGAEMSGEQGTVVAEVGYDSRVATPGSLFFCVQGETADGHDFAAAARERGAVAVVVERWVALDTPQVRVPSVREAMGPMSAVVFGQPAEAIRIVGVTGTNGKTTTTYLLEAAFRAAGLRPALIGTTGARLDGSPLPLDRTTPEAPDLHRLLARMRDEGVDALAMEVSSHGLDQHRFAGARCEVAVFTNLSQDHLDYHPSMEAYFAAKASLFTPVRAARGVVNADDEAGRRLLREPEIPLSSFGIETRADVRASDVEVSPDGLVFRVGSLVVRSALRGGFNVENCLATLAAARAMGIPDAAAIAGIARVRGVPGRLEPVDAGQEFLVVVDYAHTPDSIRRVLRGARPLASGRIIVVFGCGGDRDRAKRPLMGAAATANADLSIITSDNPRSEDPLAIISEIRPGAVSGGGEFVVEPDRRAAIRLAVRKAAAHDIVVIAGKGHETYQELPGGVVPFDDREVAREELGALGTSA